MKKLLFVSALVTLSSTAFSARTLEDVPGTVVYWRISPMFNFWPASNRIYTGGPSIVKLPDGQYLIAFNLFGDSLNPSADESGTTYIYRSSDQGQTWANLTAEPMMDMTRGSLFAHEGDVYLWGYTYNGGNIRIRKSTDNGQTWTTMVLTDTTHQGTPCNPAIWPNENDVERVWCPVGQRRLISGRADPALIMDRSRWTAVGAAANIDQQPFFGDTVSIEWACEDQIVASPHTGIVDMPKVEMSGVSAPYFAYTVLLRPDTNDSFQPATMDDWVALPGAEKKFGASYDPVSERFYVLSNPVLPAHEAGSGWSWQLIRNTAAMLSSKDLYHWDVEQIFLYSPDIDHEAFQYLNFDYDGDDMIIASRTAFDITGESGVDYPPPRGHDSNLITFHRIPDFRTVSPIHFLTCSGNAVLRYEETQHKPAPLESFVMGSVFDGTELGTVDGLAQGDNGDVFVREQGGRILRFDALGNFIEIAETSMNFQSGPLSIRQPAYGERTWTKSGGGNWEDLAHWYYWGRPDTDYEIANLGSTIAADSDLTLEKAYTIKGLRFRSPCMYTLVGNGRITIEAESGQGILDVEQGTHRINVPVVLGGDTDARGHNGTELRFNDTVDLNGRVLSILGQGRFVIQNQFVMNGGRIVLDGRSPLFFAGDASAVLDGQLEFVPDESCDVSLGAVFQLFDGNPRLAGPFTELLLLPVLPAGLMWDVSSLYTSGTLTIVPDVRVDLTDVSLLALWWLDEDCDIIPGCSYYDLAPDGILEMADLQILADRWLGARGAAWADLTQHWRLDEQTGDIAHNSISLKDGQLDNTPIWRPEEGLQGAIEFDDDNDRVALGSIDISGSFTIMGWCKPMEQSALYRRFINTSHHTGSYLGFQPVGDMNYWISWIQVDGPKSGRLRGPAVVYDTWQHVAAVYDISTETSVLYVNGVGYGPMDTSPPTQPTLDMFLGKDTTVSPAILGYYDDVAIYNAPLTGADIQAIYNAGVAGYAINWQQATDPSMASGDADVALTRP